MMLSGAENQDVHYLLYGRSIFFVPGVSLEGAEHSRRLESWPLSLEEDPKALRIPWGEGSARPSWPLGALPTPILSAPSNPRGEGLGSTPILDEPAGSI